MGTCLQRLRAASSLQVSGEASDDVRRALKTHVTVSTHRQAGHLKSEAPAWQELPVCSRMEQRAQHTGRCTETHVCVRAHTHHAHVHRAHPPTAHTHGTVRPNLMPPFHMKPPFPSGRSRHSEPSAKLSAGLLKPLLGACPSQRGPRERAFPARCRTPCRDLRPGGPLDQRKAPARGCGGCLALAAPVAFTGRESVCS